jgi:hypothetical protein
MKEMWTGRGIALADTSARQVLSLDLRAGLFYSVLMKTGGTQWTQFWSQCLGRSEVGPSNPHANPQYSPKLLSSNYEIVYNIQNYWGFGLENTKFRKLHLLLSSGERETPTLSGLSELTSIVEKLISV